MNYSQPYNLKRKIIRELRYLQRTCELYTSSLQLNPMLLERLVEKEHVRIKHDTSR